MSDAFLSTTDQMEALSRVYVSAIAAQAGYDVSEPGVDRDSIDVVLSARGHMRPQIGIQLKATTKIPAKATQFSFPLSIKNYNDLRGTTQSPRILVVLAMPKKDSSWVNHTVQRLILKRCAYWKSLLNFPDSANDTSVSVIFDTSQVFDVPTLLALMQKSRTATPL